MDKKTRIRVAEDRSIRLPREVMEKLEWDSGHYLELEVGENTVRLKRVEVDPFTEAVKAPDPDTFDKILKEQIESQQKAFDTFDEKIKDPPEVKPEDRPDHWL